MTVTELIELLEKFKAINPNMRVVVDGYEGGLKDVIGGTQIRMVLDENTAWIYGPHERVPPTEEKDYSPERIVDAISLDSKGNSGPVT